MTRTGTAIVFAVQRQHAESLQPLVFQVGEPKIELEVVDLPDDLLGGKGKHHVPDAG
jgi:hypothetical protein